MENKKEKVTIKIPKPLYDNLKEVISGTGFNSVTDFIVYVLRDIASSHVRVEDEPLTKDEIRLIRERLKSLGYL
jgi:Arc/MetJ-type ribon-helix-helix transcriptional regulator